MSLIEEFSLIASLVSRLKRPGPSVTVGIGDDAAVVAFAPDEEVLLTTDTMVEGTHFLQTTLSPRNVGYKCVAASISDIAAMGGQPRHVLLSIAIPHTYDMDWLRGLYDGIAEICEQFSCDVVGGDVVGTSGPFVITSTVTGVVPQGSALLRSGAMPGDIVFVTGHLGASAAGLILLQEERFVPVDERISLLTCHCHPVPQIAAGQIFHACGVTSCNDISDGLASELNEIATASHVRMRIDEVRIPLLPATRNLARTLRKDPFTFAWYGGEDYQLVGTASSLGFAKAISRCESVGIQLTQIGRVEPGDGVLANHADGRMELVLAKGYNHFAATP